MLIYFVMICARLLLQSILKTGYRNALNIPGRYNRDILKEYKVFRDGIQGIKQEYFKILIDL